MSNHIITLDKSSHTYYVDNIVKPSVSDILEPLKSGFKYVNRNTLANSQDLGTTVHECCEAYDKGELDIDALHPDLRQYIDGWVSFVNEYDPMMLYIEESMYSDRYQYCGTPDRICIIKDEVWVIDIKTGKDQRPPSWNLQTQAYEILANEDLNANVTRRGVVQLRPELPNGKKFIPYEDKSDLVMFKSFLNTFNYMGGKKKR